MPRLAAAILRLLRLQLRPEPSQPLLHLLVGVGLPVCPQPRVLRVGCLQALAQGGAAQVAAVDTILTGIIPAATVTLYF